mgnify:CR=1 FL=1
MDIFDRLKAPFSPEDIEFRVGSTTRDKSKGLALAYVTSRAIMDRLDSVVGPTEWQNEVKICDDGVIATLTIRVGGEWIMRQDGAQFTNIEAFKGGISDALKRVAVLFGIGRYLYSLPQEWVELDNGRMSPQTIKKLRAKLGGVNYTPKKKEGGMSQAYAEQEELQLKEVKLEDLPPVDVSEKVAQNVAKHQEIDYSDSPPVNATKEYDLPDPIESTMNELGATEVTLSDTIYGKASAKQQNMCNIIIERIQKKENNFNPVNFCEGYDTTKSMIEALIDYACNIGVWTRRG